MTALCADTQFLDDFLDLQIKIDKICFVYENVIQVLFGFLDLHIEIDKTYGVYEDVSRKSKT